MNPLVNILIPAYNAAAYLRPCLDSVLCQTYRNLHVAVVDDGSTDETPSILEEYAAADTRVEVIRKDNGGVAAARNDLLGYVDGEWFLFVDADDWIEPDMVETLLQTALTNEADMAVCDMMWDNEHASEESREVRVWNRETAIYEFIRHERISGSLCNKLISRKLLEEERRRYAGQPPFDPAISYGEDALFIWHILQGIHRLALTPRRLYHYRRNPSSISNSNFDQKKMSGHLVWEKITDDVAMNWPERKSLVSAAFAVSDFWLLFYAALSKYTFDKNLSIYQHNLKKNLLNIRRHKLLSIKKLAAALVMAFNYRIGSVFIRLSQ